MNTHFDPFPVLVTDRLILRQISYNDTPEIYFLRSDPEVMRYTGQPLAASTEEITEYIRKHLELISNGEGIIWGMQLKEETRLIGLISYRKFLFDHFRGEVGYGLHPQYHGMGLMHEALGSVIDFGFNRIGLHSVEANVDKDNTASIKLLERNQFIREAHFKENYYFEGSFIDSVIYSLIENAKPLGYYAGV